MKMRSIYGGTDNRKWPKTINGNCKLATITTTLTAATTTINITIIITITIMLVLFSKLLSNYYSKFCADEVRY